MPRLGEKYVYKERTTVIRLILSIRLLLSKQHGRIVFEKLSIKNMVKRNSSKNNHNHTKSILDATMYKIRMLAAYKTEAVVVDPKNTTRMCSGCGIIGPKKDLSIQHCN
ncbi:MAG: hypothetical protein WA667_19575 [Candidatus Nitrosopolaris sp.]